MITTFRKNKIAITSKKWGYACASTSAKASISVTPEDLAASIAEVTKWGCIKNWLIIYNKHPETNPIFAAIAGTRFVKYPTIIIEKIGIL